MIPMDKQKYIDDFTERVIALSKTPLEYIPVTEVRCETAIGMINEYLDTIDKLPKPYVLSRLADYILIADLKDRTVDKVANNDYPFLSHSQTKRRERKQIALEANDLDYVNSKHNRQLDTLSRTQVRRSDTWA